MSKATQVADTHRPIEVRELGYARRRCETCRVDWPCPDVAQERERRAAAHESDPYDVPCPTCGVTKYVACNRTAWDNTGDPHTARVIDAALAVALPLEAAQALREAADAALGMCDPPTHECIVWSEWLRARANRIDPQRP